MNIDDLTIKDLKELAPLVARLTTGTTENHTPHPFVGQYVLCRCYSAGVHTGELVSVNGDTVILRNSRRLWKWVAKQGIALSGVAQYGIMQDSKVDSVNPSIYLSGVIEVIPCTEVARESINQY